jgi:hypothetical protein
LIRSDWSYKRELSEAVLLKQYGNQARRVCCIYLHTVAVFHAGPAQPLLEDLEYRNKILWLS